MAAENTVTTIHFTRFPSSPYPRDIICNVPLSIKLRDQGYIPKPTADLLQQLGIIDVFDAAANQVTGVELRHAILTSVGTDIIMTGLVTIHTGHEIILRTPAAVPEIRVHISRKVVNK
ncbi:MAG: hypothetical protein WAV41_02360 [Microgenomates group bacterium]